MNLGRFRLTGGELRLLLLSAAFGIPIQFLLQFHGLALTTVSHASLMVGAMPVLLAAAAVLFAGERLDWIGWLALCGSTVGAALVVLGGQPRRARIRSAVARRRPAGGRLALRRPGLDSAQQEADGDPQPAGGHGLHHSLRNGDAGRRGSRAVVCNPLLRRTTGREFHPPPFAHVSPTAWAALAISGLLCTATTTLLWNWGIHHVPASRAGVFLNIEPALGSWLGVQLLGEHLGPYAWVGGALILAAAITLTTRGHEPGWADPAVILE